MGIPHLWKLIQATDIAKPFLPPSQYRKKIRVAVDVSIWLYQLTKQSQALDQPEILLRSFFYRLLKLLAQGIEPIFVFDGRPPLLKQKILAQRRRNRHVDPELRRKRIALRLLKQPAKRIKTEKRQDEWDDFNLPFLSDPLELIQSRRPLDIRFSSLADVPTLSDIPLLAQQILSLPDLTTSSIQRLLNQLPLDEDTRLGLYNELKFRSRHTSHEEVKRLEAAPALEFSARQIQGVLKRDTLMKLHLGSNEEKKSIAQEAGRYYVLQKNTDLRSGLGYTLSTTVNGQCDVGDDDDEFEDVLPESDLTVYQAKVFDHEDTVKNAVEDVSEEEDDTSEDGDLEQDYADFLEFEASTPLPPVDALFEDIPIKSKSLSPITSVDEGVERETEIFPNSTILPPMINNSIPKQVPTTPLPRPLASLPVQLPKLKRPLIETEMEEAMEEEMERKVRLNAAAPDDITNSQIKQLLELFGIPFIVSPGEAEAQCVELERLGHCQAVSSIDGDVFIFGARRVIVGEIEYEAWRLSEEWGLNQDRLIDLAMLWGCDYAPGVEGVGLVLGLEIMTNWKSLQEFKQWYTNDEDDTPEKASLRKKIRLTSDFPNERVRSAFENPLVDSASTRFVWGVPNLPGLKKFMGERVNMDPERLENSINSALSPIPRYHHHHQEASAKAIINKESNKSVRLLKALNKLKK